MTQHQLSTIDKWKIIIKSGDVSNLGNLIHNNATFLSPVVFTPQKGKKNVVKYLTSAVKMFQGKKFKYKKSIVNKNHTCAEFEAKFGNILVNGIDLITTKNDLIFEFKVFLRPLKGIEVVWEEMKERLKSNNDLS